MHLVQKFNNGIFIAVLPFEELQKSCFRMITTQIDWIWIRFRVNSLNQYIDGAFIYRSYNSCILVLVVQVLMDPMATANPDDWMSRNSVAGFSLHMSVVQSDSIGTGKMVK